MSEPDATWARSCELRLFAGDSGFAAELTLSGLFGNRFGSEDSCGVPDSDCNDIDGVGAEESSTTANFVVAVVEGGSWASGGGGGLAFCMVTVGSNGSIGEY